MISVSEITHGKHRVMGAGSSLKAAKSIIYDVLDIHETTKGWKNVDGLLTFSHQKRLFILQENDGNGSTASRRTQV